MVDRAVRNVLHINPALDPGGSLVLLASLARHLKDFNVRPVLALALRDGQIDDALRALKPLSCRLWVTYKHHADLTRWLVDKPRMVKYLALAGFEVVRAVATVKHAIEVRRIVASEHISLVHVHYCIESAIACAIQGIPFIVHLHIQPSSEVRGLARWALGRAKLVIAISRYVERSAIDRGFDPRQLVVVPNPITLNSACDPLSRRGLIEKWKVPGDRMLIGHIGRIARWKGQRELLLGISQLRNRFPHIHALFVGGSDETQSQRDYQESLIAMVASLGLTDCVTFVGHQMEVAPYLLACDVIAHTSIEPEPFGLVITEAMAAGKAIVASSLGAGPEIVTDGVTGLLVDPRDTSKLVEALGLLLANPKLRVELGEAARKDAIKRFDPRRYAATIADLYAAVAA